MLFEIFSNLKKSKENRIFFIDFNDLVIFSRERHKLRLISFFQDQSGHFCLIRWEMTMILSNSVSFSIFKKSSHRVFHIFIQNYVEAKPLEPVLWNFAWRNGRLCAFRQIQSEFPKTNTLGAIKVLLVTLAFESRVFLKKNKPDRAKMRPGRVSACIDHVTYIWRDRWTNRRVKRLSKHVCRLFVSV